MRMQCEKHFAAISFLAARLKGVKMHRFKTHPEQPAPLLYWFHPGWRGAKRRKRAYKARCVIDELLKSKASVFFIVVDKQEQSRVLLICKSRPSLICVCTPWKLLNLWRSTVETAYGPWCRNKVTISVRVRERQSVLVWNLSRDESIIMKMKQMEV